MSKQTPFLFFINPLFSIHSGRFDSLISGGEELSKTERIKWRLRKITLLLIMLAMISMPLPNANALGIGPPEFELDLQMDGSNSKTIYITSDGLTGKLVIMKDNLPFRVEPSMINLTSTDVNMPVELTFYGNETQAPGVYAGKLTFLAYTGSSVSVGIRIRANINLIGEASEIQKEPEA